MALDKAPVVDAPAVDDGLTVEERKRAAMVSFVARVRCFDFNGGLID